MKPKYIQALGGLLVFAGSFMPWAASPYGFSLGIQHFAAVPTLLVGPLILVASITVFTVLSMQSNRLAELLGLLAFLYMTIYFITMHYIAGAGVWVCMLGGILALAGGLSTQFQTSNALPNKGETKPNHRATRLLGLFLIGVILMLGLIILIARLSSTSGPGLP